MRLKAARDVLDWKGRARVEFAEVEGNVAGFDPDEIVKNVVKTGDFKFDVDNMPKLNVARLSKDRLVDSFSSGRTFQYMAYNTIRIIAGEFIPLGFQYIEYDRKNKPSRWVKTDSDVMSKLGGEKEHA